jgi:hypothetical protein
MRAQWESRSLARLAEPGKGLATFHRLAARTQG